MGAEQSTMSSSGDLSRFKWRFDVAGLIFNLTTGEEIRLTVQNGSLKFFEIVVCASNLVKYAITALTEKGAKIVKLVSDIIGGKVASMAANLIFATVQATSTAAGRAGISGAGALSDAAEGAVHAATAGKAAGQAAAGAADGAGVAAGTGARAGLSAGGKIAGGVGGGLSIVLGFVDIGIGINNLVNGTATLNQLLKFKELIELAAKKNVEDDPVKRHVLRKAAREISELAEEADAHSKGTNITKISGGGVGVAGGALTIAGIFFPPLLIPGIITSAVGAVTNVTATIVELCADHHRRLTKIVEVDLKEAEIFIVADK